MRSASRRLGSECPAPLKLVQHLRYREAISNRRVQATPPPQPSPSPARLERPWRLSNAGSLRGPRRSVASPPPMTAAILGAGGQGLAPRPEVQAWAVPVVGDDPSARDRSRELSPPPPQPRPRSRSRRVAALSQIGGGKGGLIARLSPAAPAGPEAEGEVSARLGGSDAAGGVNRGGQALPPAPAARPPVRERRGRETGLGGGGGTPQHEVPAFLQPAPLSR